MDSLVLFDPDAPVAVVERCLPHWSQPGVVAFITFRTNDSLPKSVIDRFVFDRRAWLRRHGIDPDYADWRQRIAELESPIRLEFWQSFASRWHETLDLCHGACVLRRPELSQIVFDSFLYADGDTYEMTDFVIMPNHTHLLVAFRDDEVMVRQCESWKRFTATRINRALGKKGRFWQEDAFDHLVRSIEQFEYLRRYIEANPARAGLKPTEYRHYSKPLQADS